MQIKPLNDNIILEVEVHEKVKQLDSGIIVMNNNQPQTSNQFGTVVAVGQGRLLNDGTLIEPSVKIGDNVVFDSFAGTEIISDNKKYIIIKENHILGIL